MERNRLFTGCIIFTIIAVVIVLAVIRGGQVGERYETEGVDVVVTVDEIYVMGMHQTIYGSYKYQGKMYSRVEVTNYRDAYIGKQVPCKVLPDKPFRADYVGAESKVNEFFVWVIVAFICVADVAMIMKYRQCCNVMDNGRLADGIIKSVYEKEKQFYGMVEFEDLAGVKYTVELCFGKVRKISGQECQLKYVLDSKGNAQAYYYDRMRS